MKKTNSNRLRRREPYHYDATGAQYIACIETALQHGQSIPVHVFAGDLPHVAALYG